MITYLTKERWCVHDKLAYVSIVALMLGSCDLCLSNKRSTYAAEVQAVQVGSPVMLIRATSGLVYCNSAAYVLQQRR